MRTHACIFSCILRSYPFGLTNNTGCDNWRFKPAKGRYSSLSNRLAPMAQVESVVAPDSVADARRWASLAFVYALTPILSISASRAGGTRRRFSGVGWGWFISLTPTASHSGNKYYSKSAFLSSPINPPDTSYNLRITACFLSSDRERSSRLGLKNGILTELLLRSSAPGSIRPYLSTE